MYISNIFTSNWSKKLRLYFCYTQLTLQLFIASLNLKRDKFSVMLDKTCYLITKNWSSKFRKELYMIFVPWHNCANEKRYIRSIFSHSHIHRFQISHFQSLTMLNVCTHIHLTYLSTRTSFSNVDLSLL